MRGRRPSTARPLIYGVLYVVAVAILGTAGYLVAGWSFSDSLYMVVITLFTVGYDEVHPVVTPAMRTPTMVVIVLGCTGMIYLTGALVQFLTANQLQQLFGRKRMQNEIDRLAQHVIVCGFGRIGRLLARDLRAADAQFVVVERDEARIGAARELGYLCVHGEATDEQTLVAAGIARARALATVLPDDASNVFITLSARSLNKELTIIARGEMANTEVKLLHAGANQVVQPAHIGAERMIELILHPDSASLIRNVESLQGFSRQLHKLGLGLTVATVAGDSPFARLTVEQVESRAEGAFLIVAINRDGTMISRPDVTTRIMPGDGVVLMERSGRSNVQSLFLGPGSSAG